MNSYRIQNLMAVISVSQIVAVVQQNFKCLCKVFKSIKYLFERTKKNLGVKYTESYIINISFCNLKYVSGNARYRERQQPKYLRNFTYPTNKQFLRDARFVLDSIFVC